MSALDGGSTSRRAGLWIALPHTSHTTFPVPLYVFGKPFKGLKLRAGARLADILPTMLTMMGLDVPEEMTGKTLFG